jgi:hypothetical protein
MSVHACHSQRGAIIPSSRKAAGDNGRPRILLALGNCMPDADARCDRDRVKVLDLDILNCAGWCVSRKLGRIAMVCLRMAYN